MSLTEEDKAWFSTQLAAALGSERENTVAMLASERAHTDAMFARERAHTDAMFAQERESMAALLSAVMQHEREITNAALERLETNLLRAFHQWASPMEMRARSHAAALRALDIELESVSERVKKLEDPKTLDV